MTTIRSLLWDAAFQQKKVLEKLVCYYLGITKEQLITSYDKELSSQQLQDIKTGYNAYTIDKKPLEFIMWYVEFFQRKFKVDERCLIPRPETEYMIEWVNEEITERKTNNNQTSSDILFDIGTWCGVLWLSVLLENPTYFSAAYLTEYFDNTYSLACENYAHYKNQITSPTKLVKADLIDFIHHENIISDNNNIILVANLPYIPDETFDTQAEDNVKKREPRPAFVGGKDGLDLYRTMFSQIFDYRQKTDHTGMWMMFLEMMTWQVDILRAEFGDKIDFSEIKTFHFNIRIVKGTLR